MRYEAPASLPQGELPWRRNLRLDPQESVLIEAHRKPPKPFPRQKTWHLSQRESPLLPRPRALAPLLPICVLASARLGKSHLREGEVSPAREMRAVHQVLVRSVRASAYVGIDTHTLLPTNLIDSCYRCHRTHAIHRRNAEGLVPR